MDPANSHTVRHEADQKRFVIDMDGVQALLEYRMSSPTVMDFHHTYTPDPLRGKGLAAQLVESGVAYARDQGFRVAGSCSFVAGWLQREQTAQIPSVK